MPDPVVGIIFRRDAHPAAKAFSDLLDTEIASSVLCDDHMPLSEALSRSWPNDAHFILYSVHDEDDTPVFARVSKRSAFASDLLRKGGNIKVHLIVLDYDLEDKAEWTEDSLAGFSARLADATLPDPTYWYSTLHGCRFIYQLAEPVGHSHAEALTRDLIRQFSAAGIEVDANCADWTRLFRLPRTVRSDTGSLFEPQMLNGGPEYHPPAIAGEARAEPEVFAEIKPYEGEAPDADAVRALLGSPSRPTDWAKTAQKYLKGRESYAICFEHGKIGVADGWNNGVIKIVGQVVGMLARQENSSPEGVYALLHSAIEQLQAEEDRGANQTDWFGKTWDIVCRMWANESAQVEAERASKEAHVLQARDIRADLIGTLKAARPQDIPVGADPEAFYRQRMIASDGKVHWIMRTDGSYNVKPISDSMLVPMIKELGMLDVIETHELKGKSWVSKSSKGILDDHATPVINVRCSAREPTAYIEGPPGHRVLHLPVHRLNPATKPVFSQRVDEWLRMLFGDKYDLGSEWLSWSLEVAAPICAINIYGAPGAGKGLLVAGLAECFEGERLNDGRVLGKFNEGLLHSPIINCDEGVPLIKSDEALPLDQAFRSFVSGGSITIRSMYMNPFTANIYPRIVFTSNDRDILRSIVGHRDLTDDDVRAIEIRLLSIRVDAEARDLLTSKGNYAYTAGWVHGKHKSHYILANHIRHLHATRKHSRHGSGRLLVEGEVGTRLVSNLRLRSAGAQTVLRALCKMVESPAQRHGFHVDDEARVWVTPSGVLDFTEGGLQKDGPPLTLPRIGQVLRQFSVTALDKIERSRPVGAPARGRWIEIDLGMLFEEAERYGLQSTRMEVLLQQRPEGPQMVANARLRSEPDE